MALTAGCDGAHEHPFTDGIARDTRTKFLDDSYRFVPDDEAGLDWVFASHDVEVGSADGRERYSDDRFTCSGARALYFLDSELVDAPKDVCLHAFSILDTRTVPFAPADGANNASPFRSCCGAVAQGPFMGLGGEGAHARKGTTTCQFKLWCFSGWRE